MLKHDVETQKLKFEKVKKVVLKKAKMMERQKLFVQGQLAGPEYLEVESTSMSTTSATSTTTSTIPSAITSPVPAASDPITELTKQISQLTLFLQEQSRLTTFDQFTECSFKPRCI